MLELVDKQTKRPFGTTVATASATANTVTTATTASSAYQHAAERSAHRERMPVPVPKAAEGPAGSVREGNEEVELCLGDIMATESVKQESVGGGPRGLAGIRTGAARPNEHTAKSSTTNNGLATATNRKNERLPNSSFWSDFITEHQHQHQSKPTNNFTAPNSRTPPPHAPRAAAPRTIPASTTTGAAPAKAPTQAAAQARVSATAGVVGVKRKAAEKEKEDEELRLEDFF